MQIKEEILLNHKNLRTLIELALFEDLHSGDLSSEVLKDSVLAAADFVVKQEGVIAGLIIIPEIIKIAKENAYIKNHIKFEQYMKEGEYAVKRQVIASISGDIKDILCLERTLLNFVSRISGVATYTNKMVKALKGSKPRIYDTRKTLPGWRIIDKYAVAKGGGTNHRLDLSEYLMFKDNHYQGDKQGVLEYLKQTNRKKLVELEIDKFEYFENKEIWNADIFMLDNMNLEELKKAIKIIRSKNRDYEIEISGGLGLDDLEKLKDLDVDRISIGRITHSAPSLDISLDFKRNFN